MKEEEKRMDEIKNIEELKEIADDIQVVSDGSYGYVVALFSNVDVEEVVEKITTLKFTIIFPDLIISEPIEGSLPGWV